MSLIDQKAGRFVSRLALRQADIDVDRIVGELESLHHRHTGAFQQAARMRRLVDAGDDDGFRMLAKQCGDDVLFHRQGVAAGEHHDLEARRQQRVV